MNNRKIISIILKEVKSIDNRCAGYREELIETISDILEYERQHRVQGINIQQKINDKCNAIGRVLAEKRGHISTKD